jgi:DNA-binding transcriptional LysR family regulator
MLRAGAGFAMLYEGQAREDVSRGELVPILEEFCPPFAGFYLFYPQRRHASQALRAFHRAPAPCQAAIAAAIEAVGK